MFSMQIAAMVLSVAGAGDTILLDFSAPWCGPCRSMEPVVAEMAAAGYPVRRVDVDREAQLAARYGVQSIPCFVLLVNGQEVDRAVGAMDRGQLEAMLAKAGVNAPAGGGQIARGQSPDPARRGLFPGLRNRIAGGGRTHSIPIHPARSADPFAGHARKTEASIPVSQLIESSVRLTIEDESGFSYGSGTIIDARSGEALVLTCGHVFRDSQGKGRITVDLFGAGAPKKVPGQLVSYDVKREVGLVSFRPSARVTVARLAPRSLDVARGQKVISVGCNNGADPTALASEVTSINKFSGPANLQVAGQPVQGRSGGGLFTSDGMVIGVCNAADPADNEGVYAALGEIYSQLEDAKLTALFEHPGSAGAPSRVASLAAASVTEPQPSSAEQPKMVSVPTDLPLSRAVLASTADGLGSQLDSLDAEALAKIRRKAKGAEVICIVRSLNDPGTKSEVIVLDRASPEFLKQLAAERSVQPSANLTSLDVPRAKKLAHAYAAGSTRPATAGRAWQAGPLMPR